jgi:DNA-binding transcriptional LysR family regulator
MRFDLTDLKLFAAVVEHGSISAGARASNLSIPSASARLSGMEDLLGVALLNRLHRGIRPTPAGENLVQHARQILLRVEQMHSDMALRSPELRHLIRLQSNTGGLVSLVPAALAVFLKEYPNVDIDLKERSSADVIRAVSERTCEIGIISSSVDAGSLETRTVGKDQLVVIVGRDHPLGGRAKVKIFDLVEEPFVGLVAGTLAEQLAHRVGLFGYRLNFRVHVRSYEQLAELVGAGVGIAIVPRGATRRDEEHGVVTLELDEDWASHTMSVCARRFAELSSHAARFVDELERQALREKSG